MHSKARLLSIFTFFMVLISTAGCDRGQHKSIQQEVGNQIVQNSPMHVQIIIGSVRSTHMGAKIAKQIKDTLNTRQDVQTEIVDITDYALPFYTQEMAPANRKTEITDPVLKRWSDKIQEADGYIIVSPEYNHGYTAPLKNALDSLYVEWNNKPVAFVGYSGGESGGATMIAQLREVAHGLQMIPISAELKIPQSWKAFDEQGHLVGANAIAKEVNIIVDQLLMEHAAPKEK